MPELSFAVMDVTVDYFDFIDFADFCLNLDFLDSQDK